MRSSRTWSGARSVWLSLATGLVCCLSGRDVHAQEAVTPELLDEPTETSPEEIEELRQAGFGEVIEYLGVVRPGGSPWIAVSNGELWGPGGAVWILELPSLELVLQLGGTTKLTGFGAAVALGPDLDGDGARDVLVGCTELWKAGPGRVYAYSSASGEQLRELVGPTDGERFGVSIDASGDFDGDGVLDVAIGASGHWDREQPGAVYIYGGAELQLVARLLGESPRDQFGHSLAFVRTGEEDVLLVGAPGQDPYMQSPDEAPLVPAVRTGYVALVRSGSRTVVRPEGLFEGVSFGDAPEPFAGAYFGLRVGSAGDLDGDGDQDAWVSAPFGGGEGHAPPFVALLTLRSAEGPVLLRFLAGEPGTCFGESVSCWPGSGKDGGPTIAVGASEGGRAEEGQVAVFRSVASAAPQEYLRDQGWSIDYAFGYSVALVPDLDGDGLLDVVAGSPTSPIGPWSGVGEICILPSAGPLLDTASSPWTTRTVPLAQHDGK